MPPFAVVTEHRRDQEVKTQASSAAAPQKNKKWVAGGDVFSLLGCRPRKVGPTCVRGCVCVCSCVLGLAYCKTSALARLLRYDGKTAISRQIHPQTSSPGKREMK